MNENQLYLKWNDTSYDLVMESFDEKKIYDAEFLFKEAAVIILYPDGKIDAVKSGKYLHHTEYYKCLYSSSSRFKEAIDSLDLPFDWQKEDSTYALDCYLSSLGISSLHNVSIHVLPYHPNDLKNFISNFYVFKTDNITNEAMSNLKIIYDNYPTEAFVNNIFSASENRFRREEEINNRRV